MKLIAENGFVKRMRVIAMKTLIMLIMIMVTTSMVMVMMKHRYRAAGLFCQIVGETIVPRFAPLPSNSLSLSLVVLVNRSSDQLPGELDIKK